MHAVEIRDALHRIQIEFTQWPTLTLTRVQTQRLWSLPPDVCDTALANLVDTGFLSYTDGIFVRHGMGSARRLIRRADASPPQTA